MKKLIVSRYGTKSHYFNGVLHREDGPAIEWADGAREWRLNGLRHREGGPAIECSNGYKEWWLNGKLHRVDGPAIENLSGAKVWYLAGRRFKTRETFFNTLNKKDKMKALFSEHFIIK